MENGVGARSANVKILWSAPNFGIFSERGALFHSKMGSERGVAMQQQQNQQNNHRNNDELWSSKKNDKNDFLGNAMLHP